MNTLTIPMWRVLKNQDGKSAHKKVIIEFNGIKAMPINNLAVDNAHLLKLRNSSICVLLDSITTEKSTENKELNTENCDLIGDLITCLTMTIPTGYDPVSIRIDRTDLQSDTLYFEGAIKLIKHHSYILESYKLIVKDVFRAFARLFYDEGDYENIDDCIIECTDLDYVEIAGCTWRLSDALTALRLGVSSDVLIKWYDLNYALIQKASSLEYFVQNYGVSSVASN